MKLLVILLVLLLLVSSYFFYQGRKSAQLAGPVISSGTLPLCGARPNCVCSLQSVSDSHYIEPFQASGVTMDSVRAAIEQLGGVIVSGDDDQLHATFQSSVFGFFDDVLLLIDDDNLQVRSSSRVGHSDLGANRKRLERLREML